MNTEELKAKILEKGMEWGIAALVDGSIGYHTPKGAKLLLERALKGEAKDYCERCLCCYKGDLMTMIEHDFKCMEHIEKYHPEKFRKLLEAVVEISKLTDIEQQTVSLMYPTIGI